MAKVMTGAPQRTVMVPPGRPTRERESSEELSQDSRARAEAMIREVIAKLGSMDAQAATEQHGQGAGDPAVRYHAHRLQARGLEEAAAYRQAMAMVADAAHGMACSVCSQFSQRGG